MHLMFELSQDWVDFLSCEPETGMGYQKVKITLSNGEVKEKIVLNCQYIETMDGYFCGEITGIEVIR